MGKSHDCLTELNRRKKIGDAFRKTHRQFIKEVYDLVGCEYSILSKYKTTHEKVLVKHNQCGYKWEVTPAHFLSGTRCPKCAQNLKRDTKYFKELVYKAVGNEYIVLGEYINSQTGVLMRHVTCGNVWKAHPNHFLFDGTRCPICSQKKWTVKQTLTQEQYQDKVTSLYGDEYEVLSKYINGNQKILIKHNVCGHEWRTYPYNLLRGHKCPICNSESSAERMVFDYLVKNNIKFEHQVSYQDCRNKVPLRFDFRIEINGKFLLVELDGQQHYIAMSSWGSEGHLKYVQNNDRIKTEYCLKHNIPLIRIPYWEFDNIEKILENKIIEVIKKAS